MDAVLARMDSLQEENAKLKEDNGSLTKRVAQLEQYSRQNYVEICGVPEPRNENIVATVSSVAKTIQFNLDVAMIDACHRLRFNNNKPEMHRGIIVKFVSRLQKKEFLKAKRVKRTLSASNLDSSVTVPTPVYINESLSPDNRKLYAQCRVFQSVKKIEFLWVCNGQIKMRKAVALLAGLIDSKKLIVLDC